MHATVLLIRFVLQQVYVNLALTLSLFNPLDLWVEKNATDHLVALLQFLREMDLAINASHVKN